MSEDFSQSKMQHRVLEVDNSSEINSEAPFLLGAAEQEHDELNGHARNLSAESIWSDVSSIKGSELSNYSASISVGDGSVDLPCGAGSPMEAFSSIEMQLTNDALLILPLDQQHKLNRILVMMQHRLVTAKADMEELIARLNQEIAVKQYLTSKVKDLEVELEATKQKSKVDLQQGILLERERVTQMQWDRDEIHRKYFEMESKYKSEQLGKVSAESEKITAISENKLLLQKLDNKRQQLKDLQKQLEEVEIKSKEDIKVLVKEVKSLRSSQAEMKGMLDQSLKERTELERVLQKEKQRNVHADLARKKLLNGCVVLRRRLQESSVSFLAEGENKFTVDSSSLSDALGLLSTSDTRIGLLLAEAQLLVQDWECALGSVDRTQSSEFSETHTATDGIDDPRTTSDDVMMKLLLDSIIDSARLTKQGNAVMRCALKMTVKPLKEDSVEVLPKKTILDRFLQR